MPNYRSTTEDKLGPLKSVINLHNIYIKKILYVCHREYIYFPSTKTIRLRTLIEITASIIIPRTSLIASFRITHPPNHDISHHKVGSARKVANKLYLILVLRTGRLTCYTASFHKQFQTFRMIYSVHLVFNRVTTKMTAVGSFETSGNCSRNEAV
jgi:hypothetical protein